MKRSEFNGEAVYEGLSDAERAYARGWSAGHDDGSEGVERDSTLAVEKSWYASGYRAGYEIARPSLEEDEEKTIIRHATVLLALKADPIVVLGEPRRA